MYHNDALVFSYLRRFHPKNEIQYWLGAPDESIYNALDLSEITSIAGLEVYPIDKETFVLVSGTKRANNFFLLNTLSKKLSKLKFNESNETINQIALSGLNKGELQSAVVFGRAPDSFLLYYTTGNTNYSTGYPRRQSIGIVSHKYPKGIIMADLSIKFGKITGFSRNKDDLIIKAVSVFDETPQEKFYKLNLNSYM